MLPKISAVCGAAFAALTLAGSPAGHAGGLCDDLAAHIRAGEANPTSQGNGTVTIERLAARPDSSVEIEHGDDVDDFDDINAPLDLLMADLQPFHPSPELVQAVTSFIGTGGYGNDASTSFYRLGTTGAGVITATGGTMHCKYTIFFNTLDGQAHEIDPPPGITFGGGDVCWDTGLWIGSAGGTPAIFVETNDADKSETVVAPWVDHRWGKVCEIDAAFQRSLKVDGSACQKGVDCNHMQDAALSIGNRLWREYPKDTYEDFRAAPDVPAPIVALVRQLPHGAGARTLVNTFGQDFNYNEQDSTNIYLVNVDGASDVGVVGQASWGWREWPGYVAAIYAPTHGKLVPVASVLMGWTRGPVVSVTVKEP